MMAVCAFSIFLLAAGRSFYNSKCVYFRVLIPIISRLFLACTESNDIVFLFYAKLGVFIASVIP